MASLEQVQGEFEIQVRSLAAGDQVATELSDGDGVGLSVQAYIVHDILAAVDTVLDVCIEVAAYLLIVGKVVQRDFGERQKAGDLLWKRHKVKIMRELVLHL